MEGKAFVEVGPLLVEHLVRQNRMDEPTFSFYMKTMNEGRSHVDFGRPDRYSVKNNDMDRVAHIPVLTDLFWSQYL